MNLQKALTVNAWSRSEPVELSVEEIAHIELSGIAEVVAATGGEGLSIRTTSRVGVLVTDELELRVVPRLPIPRLMFLLGYALDPKGWKRLTATFDEVDDLVTAIASGFSWHATWALDRGVLRGYIHRDEREAVLRGRIRFGDQIARGGGLPLPLEVSYDDFTEDVLENRMLRTAASLVLRLPRLPAQARLRLLHLRSVLAEVAELSIGQPVKAPAITRLNERYAPALALAELILSSASVGSGTGTTASTTFIFDMNRVFEDFVTIALGESLARHGGELRGQVRERKLSDHIALKPDLAWWRNGTWEAVLDAKYKPLHGESFPNGDAYQMLAYTLAYELPEGWLIYARAPGELESRTHEIVSAGKRIIVTALDVTRDPEELLADVTELASKVAQIRSAFEVAA